MRKLTSFLPLVFLLACSSGPRPIKYGTDQCELCKMTVMDNKFGTEIVTKKGKIMIFDSDECMRDYIKSAKPEAAQFLVTDFTRPGSLIDGKTATFLHSPNMRSPMGGNLAAYGNKADAEAAKSKLGGDLLNWDAFLTMGK